MSTYEWNKEEGENSLSNDQTPTAVQETQAGLNDIQNSLSCTSCRKQQQLVEIGSGNTKACSQCCKKTVLQQPTASPNVVLPGCCTDGSKSGLLHEEPCPSTAPTSTPLDKVKDDSAFQPSTASSSTGSPVTGFQSHNLPPGEYLKKQPSEGVEFGDILMGQESGGENVQNPETKGCVIVVLGRGQKRKATTYTVYIVTEDMFEMAFPIIQRNEAVIYQSSLITLNDMETKLPQHRYNIPITKQVDIRVRLCKKETFKITSADKFTVPLEHIERDSMDRLFPKNVVFQVTCTGSLKEWCEDRICLSLTTGTETFHLTFSIWAYQSDSQWQTRESLVVAMPEEDIRAMRKCHVDLLNSMHQIFDVLQYLYQLEILEEDEISEIQKLSNRKCQVADILEKIKTRGDVLDMFIEVLSRTKNGEAAKTLLENRMQCAGKEEKVIS